MSPDRAPESEPAAGGDADGGAGVAAVRLIRDVETLRAMSDPTRMRILETMVQRVEPAWSVKELAAAMGVPQTRLYHHVELLAEADLIRATERRVVSGIIETRYRVAAQTYQLDRSLLSGRSDEAREAVHHALTAIFDTARAEVELAIHLEAIDPSPDAAEERRAFLFRALTRLAPAQAAEFRERLRALTEEYCSDAGVAEDGTPFGVVLAVYPLPPTVTEPTDA